VSVDNSEEQRLQFAAARTGTQAVLLGSLWYDLRMKRALQAAGLVAGSMAVLVVVAFAVLAWQVDRLGGRDEARASDAIIVLGARVEANGRPGSDLTSRTYHAVDLWQAGYAPYLICTGGYENEWLSAANVCRRFAIELGVAPGRVLLADGTSNTDEDAIAAARVMADHGWRTAILVSHPLHLFRARWLFRNAGVDAITSPTSTETDRIFPLLRAWYALRESGAIILTALNKWGWLPSQWTARLQAWSYGLP
jgi:uncharacterized SAM-binding protein YcdF (DUF218 family)